MLSKRRHWVKVHMKAKLGFEVRAIAGHSSSFTLNITTHVVIDLDLCTKTCLGPLLSVQENCNVIAYKYILCPNIMWQQLQQKPIYVGDCQVSTNL